MKQMIQINSPDSRGNWFVTVRAKVITELRVELNETKAALEREQQDCAALRQMVRELRDALAECREDSVELLGRFDSMEEAVKVSRAAMISEYGEFCTEECRE